MHRSKYDSGILNSTEDVFGAIVPVDSDGIDRVLGVILCMQEFHNPRQVVGFAWGLAHEVDMVWMHVRAQLHDAVGRAGDLPFA